MDARALRYFVETVRHASFTQAARALFVTQSTVSKMIRQLEEEAGAQLLIRDGHTARPTDTGRVDVPTRLAGAGDHAPAVRGNP